MQIGNLSQFHENPRVIEWWHSRFSPVLNWLTPVRRRTLLALAAVWICIQKIRKEVDLGAGGGTVLPVPHDWLGVVIAFNAVVLLSYLFYLAAAGYRNLPGPVKRHPQLCLHGVYWGILAVLWMTAPDAGRWRETFVMLALLFPFTIWRFGYMLLAGQYGRIAGTRFMDHFLTIWPAYGGSNTPVGNGFGYLSRAEAKTAEDLARSQLAGIKLLLLSGILNLIANVMKAFIYGPGTPLTTRLGGMTLGIPLLEDLSAAGGQGASPWLSWLSIYCELIIQVLRHAASGHVIIAVLRLFGFNVFRNTYKPLLSESIVEFWNRYYFYFKEIMANFFFLPTFSRLGSRLKNWPALRLFLAVFSAAFVGNTYYHLLKLNEVLVAGNVWGAIYGLRSRMFYCLLLAFGMFISMLREQRRAGSPLKTGWPYRLARMAGVWTFFGLIFIWNVRGGGSFADRTRFFFSLFGLA